jgi:hypothetical protein
LIVEPDPSIIEGEVARLRLPRQDISRAWRVEKKKVSSSDMLEKSEKYIKSLLTLYAFPFFNVISWSSSEVFPLLPSPLKNFPFWPASRVALLPKMMTTLPLHDVWVRPIDGKTEQTSRQLGISRALFLIQTTIKH